MKLKAVYWVIAVLITLVGIGIMAVGAAYCFSHPQTKSWTDTFTSFDNLDVELSTSSLRIESDPAAAECMVECIDVPSDTELFLDGDTLKIKQEEKQKFQLISFGWDLTLGEVIITLPEEDYEKFAISIGLAKDSEIAGVTCKTVEIDAGVGTLTLRDMTIEKEFNMDGGTGDLLLQDVTLEGKSDIDLGVGELVAEHVNAKKTFEIDLGTGDCEFRECQFDEMDLDGGVGDVMILSTTLNGDAKFMQGTGDFELELMGDPDLYSIRTESGMGDVTIDGDKIGELRNDDAKYEITVECGVGDVDIRFPDKD